MKKESRLQQRIIDIEGLVRRVPQEVITALMSLYDKSGTPMYIVGGPVRDWLLDLECHDFDITVPDGAELLCRELIRLLGEGAYVQLGTDDEEAARVVWRGFDIDVSSFRGGVATIEEDLALRDYTVNAIAVNLADAVKGSSARTPDYMLIDPLNGVQDLFNRRLRHCPNAFEADPLRMLRGYRFVATLGFDLAPDTLEEIREQSDAICRIAAERIRYELDKIMATDYAAEVLWQMDESEILCQLLPELYEGIDVEQPDFHHLDVFHHNFQTLHEMEQLLAVPGKIYPDCKDEVIAYTKDGNTRRCLKWAALLHDIGKPAAMGEARNGSRVTFYGHDEIGRAQFEVIARRLRWSNEDRERTGHLVAMHMHPFHLCNVRRGEKLTRRAALKLCKRAGDDLPGLFLLAMSDSLASQGELKPQSMEKELVELYSELTQIYREHILPALTGPPLLGGKELIDEFGLTPGPVFKEILGELEMLQVEGVIESKEQAVSWARLYIEEHGVKED
ncbi:CCA tRNA nucleotidyltransferase [Desulfosediminicola sp.]|uniref:CCA tRNA nucleotidyltransferase n=1 Tax=Desulfosediminicola sp. TaxID=2886825 RepID=UPI003AF2ADBB